MARKRGARHTPRHAAHNTGSPRAHAPEGREGKGSETIDLAALTVQQQLKRAMDWAGGLGRVDVEIELSSENAMASSIVSSLRGR